MVLFDRPIEGVQQDAVACEDGCGLKRIRNRDRLALINLPELAGHDGHSGGADQMIQSTP